MRPPRLTLEKATAYHARFPEKPTSTLDLKEIKDLIALMRKNDLSVFKMEKEGFKITLKRGNDSHTITTSAPVALPLLHQPVLPFTHDQTGGTGTGSSESKPEKFKEITSPMVGTFYSAPTPEAAPYVTVGQEISEETVICIIEAMKVMNEIKAEISGTIVEIVAENGKPVQFGQVLFRVR